MDNERYAMLPVENGVLEAVRRFLAGLLEKKLVDALLVPLELPTGDNVVPTIVSSPEQLQKANPLAPVMPVNTSRIVSRITLVSSSPERLGVVLRSCELRALIELVKLKQASLENLLLIGVDCFGTYSIDDYGKAVQESSSLTTDFLSRARKGEEDPLLAWYLRPFRDLQFVSGAVSSPSPVVITPLGETQHLSEYRGARYRLQSSWQAASPSAHDLTNWFLFRESLQPPVHRDVLMWVAPETRE